MSRDYPRLDVVTFGRQLFQSRDLDPIYLATRQAVPDRDQLARWLVSYCLFYSAGASCFFSEQEGKEFWRWLTVAAKNEQLTPAHERWPRGAERRHFRGQAAEKGVSALQQRYGNRPEGMLAFLTDGPMDVRSVIARACEHYLFGSWLSFKVADLIDAVWGVPVEQDDLEVFLYDTPRKSIVEKWQEKLLPIEAATEAEALPAAMYWLQQELSDCRIPHKPKKKPDWFSLETVFCKHHSHLHGHYHMGKDTAEINHGLIPWCRDVATARAFAKAMPKVQSCLTM